MTAIHVLPRVIQGNRETGANYPTLVVEAAGGHVRAHQLAIRDSGGNTVARLVYRPDDPLPCGAVVWVETDLEVHPE